MGRRSNCWLKVKIVGRQEFVIAGWTGESTGLANRVGTMLIVVLSCIATKPIHGLPKPVSLHAAVAT